MATNSKAPDFRRDGARALAPLLLLAAWLAFSGHAALAQSAARADLQGQIRRYGCHLPQYATSVEGCRRLHERARALAAQPAAPQYPRPDAVQPPPAYRGAYPAPAYPRAHPEQPPPAAVPRRQGLFDFLLGGRTSPYRPDSDYYYSPSPEPAPEQWAAYRTLCVRLCDGYYWPISYSAPYSRIPQDAQQCQSSCKAPAKLYFHRNPGGTVEQMVDLDGNAYSQLEAAFRYRQELVPDCRCKPEPWTEAAKEEYARRAAGEYDQPAEPPADHPKPMTNADALPKPRRPQPATAPWPPLAPPPMPPPQRRGLFESLNPFGRWSTGRW